MDIGAKIKLLRIKNQLTLEELANRSELTKGFLFLLKLLTSFFKDIISYAFSNRSMCFTQYSYFPLITAREITIFWTSEVPS